MTGTAIDPVAFNSLIRPGSLRQLAARLRPTAGKWARYSPCLSGSFSCALARACRVAPSM